MARGRNLASKKDGVEPAMISPLLLARANPSASTSSLECDCACAEASDFLAASEATSSGMLMCAEVHSEWLSDDRVLAFNPLSTGGVAVLDRAAWKFLRRFAGEEQVNAAALNPEQMGLARRMQQCGLLVPRGGEARLRAAESRVLSAWFHVTNACNMACQYCYVQKSPEAMEAGTGRAAVDAIFRSMTRGGFAGLKLKFAGGEATLNPEVVLDTDAYARAEAAGRSISYESILLTNGVRLTDSLIAECRRRGMRMMVSLDGLGATHDRQRSLLGGQGSARRVCATIDRLLAQGIKPFISITVTDRSAETLPQTVGFVLERGLSFNLNFVRESAGCKDFETLRLRDQRLIAALKATFAVIEQQLPEQELLGMLIDRANFVHPHARTCGVGENYLVVDQHGRITRCHMELDRPLTDIWAADPLSLVRADPRGVRNPPVEEKEGCRACEWRYWCAGGCPKATFEATGAYDVKSPLCDVYKEIFPDLLRLEALRLLRHQELAPAAVEGTVQ